MFSSFDFLYGLFQILTLSCLNPSHHDSKSLNCSSQPLLYQFPSSFFNFTSSLLPVPVYFQFLPVYFQSTFSLLLVYFQFLSRFQPTYKSTFFCQIFVKFLILKLLKIDKIYSMENNDDFGQNIPFWLLIHLKP